MSWGKIKKAINSRLGESDFKPLDRIIIDGIDSIKSGLENGTIKPEEAKTLGGLSKERLRGNETKFTYKDAHSMNANNSAFEQEGHYFFINGANLPYRHGYLDSDYFDGVGFSPNFAGKTECLKQTFRPLYEESDKRLQNDVYVRTGYKSPSMNNYKWSSWIHITGENARVKNAELAEKATELSDTMFYIAHKVNGSLPASLLNTLDGGLYVIDWEYNNEKHSSLVRVATGFTSVVLWQNSASTRDCVIYLSPTTITSVYKDNVGGAVEIKNVTAKKIMQ